jgi:hypothetical protein
MSETTRCACDNRNLPVKLAHCPLPIVVSFLPSVIARYGFISEYDPALALWFGEVLDIVARICGICPIAQVRRRLPAGGGSLERTRF